MILESRDTFFLSLSLRPTTNSWRPWTDTNKKKRNSSLYNSVLQKYKIYFDYFITICPHPLVTNLLLSISLPQSAFPDDSTEFSSTTRKKQLSNKARWLQLWVVGSPPTEVTRKYCTTFRRRRHRKQAAKSGRESPSPFTTTPPIHTHTDTVPPLRMRPCVCVWVNQGVGWTWWKFSISKWRPDWKM